MGKPGLRQAVAQIVLVLDSGSGFDYEEEDEGESRTGPLHGLTLPHPSATFRHQNEQQFKRK